MSPTRRLDGIAALSAGALASVGLSTPVTAADVPGDEPGIPPTGEGIPEDLLIQWESERGVDLPADLFYKLQDAIAESPSGSAFDKWEYRPGSETSEPLLIKWDYPAGGSATGDAFDKIEYGLDDAEGQAAIRELGDAFNKIEGTTGDSRPEELFLKYDGIDGEALTTDPFLEWDFESAAAPAADAFIKLAIAADDIAGGVVFSRWEYDALDREATLRLRRSAGVEVHVPADLLEALFLVDGERPLGRLLDEVATARGASPAPLRVHALPVFLRLYECGYLESDERG